MRGFFPTSTNGPFGAAAAAGKLLHLTPAQMTHALGIAGSQACGLFEGIKEGMMTKRFGAGKAAQNGIVAADLAKLGFTGPSTVLEGDWGYLKAFSDEVEPSALTGRLGESYNIMETTFKPYPCCKALHSAIDAMLDLTRECRFVPEEVSEIVVGGYEKIVKMHDIYEPATSMAAQFSMPYVLTVALMKRGLGVEDFDDGAIRDPRVLALARKVRLELDPEVMPFFPAHEPGKVTVELTNGKRYSKTVICSKGTPENPMSAPELEAKFLSFASRVISRDRAQAAAELVRGLDKLESIGELSSLLAPSEGPRRD
jgi:2-methylcitrate dehydratase PrpD